MNLTAIRDKVLPNPEKEHSCGKNFLPKVQSAQLPGREGNLRVNQGEEKTAGGPRGHGVGETACHSTSLSLSLAISLSHNIALLPSIPALLHFYLSVSQLRTNLSFSNVLLNFLLPFYYLPF